jgi:penicillin-binding protein 1A
MPRKKTKAKKPVKTQKRTYKRKKQKPFSLKVWLLKWGFVAGVWAGVIVFFMLAYYAHDLPSVKKLDESFRTPNIKILDKNNEVIANIGNLYGDYIHFDDMPQHLIDAVISTEDRRFFDHFGVDPVGLVRAFIRNYRAGRVVQGGSTITQQLAKVVFLSPERTIKRKVQEMMLALYLEHKFSKEEILTMYLNRIYLGSGNYGVDAATRSYFGKSAKHINLFEAATIAGLIKAPSRYSPANNFELSQERADQVLGLMVDNNTLSTEDIIFGGIDENYVIARRNVRDYAPYFVDWVKEQIYDYIGDEEGGQIFVRTTLDPKMQMAAEEALASSLAVIDPERKVSQGAIISMSPDGAVLAMVGGKSYKESQFNRATQAYRQPGSAFKFFVYLTALEKGYKPNDIVVDEPLEIDGWKPENWNHQYVGEVSLRNALANSINTVSARLLKDVGVNSVANTARRLGISTPITRDLTLALGSSEVTLVELTGAYAHMANYGNSVWVHGINDITTDDGRVIYSRYKSGQHRVVAEDVTAQMNDMLLNVIESGTGKQAKLPWRDAAGKTGTSQDSRDAWFIGYTKNVVTGVWVGNDDNTPMNRVGGGGLPALVWKHYMKSAHEGVLGNSLPVTEYSVKQGRKTGSIWESIIRTFGGR